MFFFAASKSINELFPNEVCEKKNVLQIYVALSNLINHG